MDNTAAALAGHTTKYNIPLSHFEYKYIQNCTNGKELEKIYKELIGGEVGSFPALEKLTFERIQDVKPNSHILRTDKAPLDKTLLPDEERQQLDDFLNQMKETKQTSSNTTKDHQNNGINLAPIRSKSIATNSTTTTPTSSVSVINKNGKQKRIVPRSYDEWGKLDQKLSQETNSDSEDDNDDENPTESRPPPPPTDQIHEKSQRLHMAEQHRLNGNTAFKSNNYQQSIDLYTKSIMLDNTNLVVYMNRALAHFKLNHYDESLLDCSKILSQDPHHIKGSLFRRASCFVSKQQYNDAKRDLDLLLSIDHENNDAKSLLKTIPTAQKTKGVRIPITEDDGDDEEQIRPQPPTSTSVKIPILEVEEEDEEHEEQLPQVTNESIQSMSIDIPQKSYNHARPCIDSQEASPALFDHHFHHRDDINQFQQNVHSQLSSLNHETEDDDDDMALGDEAGGDILGNMSDDDGNVSHSLNVSPTMDDDDDNNNDEVPALVDQNSLPTTNSNTTDRNMTYTMNETYNGQDFMPITNKSSIPTISNNYSLNKQNSISSNSYETNEKSLSSINSSNDHISSSNFCPTIQNWLRDLVILQSNNRPSTLHEKTWSKSSRPWALDKLQRDIERFNRLNDFKNAVEASKKMLKNGVLDYHNHADHIVSTLIICAQCYSKVQDYVHTIQYTTEALQYNKTDANALICRAKAFENEKFLLYSYADYARIPANDYSYLLAQRACEKLTSELNVAEGENWREKLPKDTNDDERYLAYIKIKDNSSTKNQFEWYRERGNQLYIDACFILAIQCYTYCIELKSTIATLYSNRAACYLKVFEPQKTIDDCDQALKIDPINARALYRKACAYKMLHNTQLYESTLKELLKLQPNNQTILTEYYTSRHEPIPREMRRLRTNNNNTNNSTSISKSTDMKNTKPTTILEEINLSFEELEQLRMKKNPLSLNTPYQFTQQLNTLKSDDIKGQCSLILRLPTKGLFGITSTATPKLVEIIINACRTMVLTEQRHQQENKSSILPFSYITFCYNILGELTTLPRIESALSMINQTCRASLDDLLQYYAALPAIFNDVNRLDRLRQ
ncbi:unnamed protein product [Adineta steineri]|uniref:Uncharacterized protein n=1 Tax=Adineta steineri TaxID=433720 RepID=A0A818HWJ8_9BILA|nr:unnamed protein product [Adineta steineri]CAF3512451.1 unnamed protein product [Adineta steineri]